MERGLLTTYEEAMSFVGWARSVAGASGETREGTRAFLEKRQPDFDPPSE
jgi:1,4-dihydroxy-2-naphthoyl-CoA synthase